MNHTQEGIKIVEGFIYKIIDPSIALYIYHKIDLFALFDDGSESLILSEDEIEYYGENGIQIGIAVGTLDESYLIKQLRKDHAFVLWNKGDIADRAEEDGIELTEDQLTDCIDYLQRRSHCEYGITWDSIDNVIEKFKEYE